MIKRIISGAVLIALVVGIFFLRTLVDVDYFTLFITVISVVGTIEMMRAVKKLSIAQSILTAIMPIFIFEGYIFIDVFKTSFTNLIAYVFIAYIIINLALLVLDNKHSKLEGFSYALVCAIYPTALLLPMALANNFANNSLVALLLMFIVPPFADMFAYWVGITLKGKKLCPKISPKKTISGAIGGLIGGIIGAIALYFIAKATGILVYNYVFPGWLAFGLIGLGGAFLCELGDLIESVIKRQLGIKDMGNLIPGHGGVMDRVDSIIFTAPFIYLIFVLI